MYGILKGKILFPLNYDPLIFSYVFEKKSTFYKIRKLFFLFILCTIISKYVERV
jgi:hypothetical protein